MSGIQNDEGLAVVDRCESDVAGLGHGKDGFDGNFSQLGDSGALFVAALVQVMGWFYWHMFFRDNLRRSAPYCAGDISEGGLWRELAQLLVAADGVGQREVEVGLKECDFVPSGGALAMAFPNPGVAFEGDCKGSALLFVV